MKGTEKKEDESSSTRSIISIINGMDCPDPHIILELVNIRNYYKDTGVSGLMIRAYLLGLYDGMRINH